MGIPPLISTATASNATDVSITSGIDSTYDEYMFVFTDIGPATDGEHFTFQCNAAGESGYNEIVQTTYFYASHNEADSSALVEYHDSYDQALGTGYQILANTVGNGSDESSAGILHLFSPSSTTYVTHFYSKFSKYWASDYAQVDFISGYFNIAAAIDEIQFKMTSGNFDGVIQMYGIS